MKAMILEKTGPVREGDPPLRAVDREIPEPGAGQVRLRVDVCGVCHTELDEIEGRTPPPRLPVIPGHQVVGTVDALGDGVDAVATGDRVGVAWIYDACGACDFCRGGRENLCPDFRATGRDADGGYAEYLVAPAAFVHPIPDALDAAAAAPLLCAGAVGYRAFRLAQVSGDAALGLTGFGASAHLVLLLLRHHEPDLRVHVFARNPGERDFARELGAVWAGDTGDEPPEPLDAIIDTTPVWRPVVAALPRLAPGGRLVINAIRKEDGDRDELAKIDYGRDLWMERELKSVANVTRRDVREFLALAAEIPIEPHVQTYALEDANRALLEMKQGRIRGAKVLAIGER